MYLTRLSVLYILVVTFINSEIITFIQNNNVVCVAIYNTANSTISYEEQPISNDSWKIEIKKDFVKAVRKYEKPLHVCELSEKNEEEKSNCDIGTFGSNCNITCVDIFGKDPYCENYIVCIKNRDCFFENNSEEKSNECEISCQQCDKTSYCKTYLPKIFPVVLRPPLLKDISKNSIRICINLTYGVDEMNPEKYIVQYKEISEENFTTHITGDYSKEKFNCTEIYELDPKRYQYKVRILLIAQNQSVDENIPELTTYKRTLMAVNKTLNGFILNWSHPENKVSYRIERVCRQKFCEEKFTPYKSLATSATTVLQYDLKPFTECSIKLFIGNEPQKKFIDKIKVTTLGTTTVDENEVPLNINQSGIYFQECEKFSGPINYTFTYQCLSEWCKNVTQSYNYFMSTYNNSVNHFSKLLPFTSYTLTVKAERSNVTQSRKYKLKTFPEQPHGVRNLSIYCSNDTDLWIEWQPPYPPTGDISHYLITKDNNCVQTINKLQICPQNKNFICASVKGTSGYITVQAKNNNFTEYGPSEIVLTNSWKKNARRRLENFTVTVSSSNEVFLVWKYLFFKNLQLKVETNSIESTITLENCTDSCEYRISSYDKEIDDEVTYTITVSRVECESNNIVIKMLLRSSPAELSEKPLIEICLKKCIMLIPESNNNSTSYSIQVERRNEPRILWTVDNLQSEEGYFKVNIGDDLRGGVSLRNQSYVMFLLSSGKKYPLFASSTSNVLAIRNALICLFVVVAVTIIVLVYLGTAYILKIYPFDILKPRMSTTTTCNRSRDEIRQFSEHYRMTKVRKVRSKVDVPVKESEPLIETLKHKNTNITSVPIKLEKFEDYLMRSLGDNPYSNDLTMQYGRIQLKTVKPCTTGLLKKNSNKNRYTNLIAYDDTRVVLKDNDCDYINANYVDGYENEKAFIATQAPSKTTLGDFWWMIWQERATYIIMLTKLVETGTIKCEKYWPDLKHRARFGKILIENISVKNFSDYVYRQFKVACDHESRIIHHFQYVTWPDHDGVPLYSQNFTPFVKRILVISQRNSIVVHCNAGCGRTGTLILCDIVLRMAAKEKTLDFVKILARMREQRVSLVNNVNQYVFAHFVVLECLFGVDFSIPVNDSFQDEVWKMLRKTTVKPLMEELDKVMIQFKKRQVTFIHNMSEEDKRKNRFPDILPSYSQIHLPSVTSGNASTYINAVVVDCYRCPKKFIVTQQPLPNTLKDFWTLVKEYTVNTIVCLNETDGKDPNCPKFWLWNDEETKLEILEEIEDRPYSITKLKITDKSIDKTINIIKMKNWRRETPYPTNSKDLIFTWKETFNSSWKRNSQIVVTCYDGATASGLFVALAYLLEKINYEQSCDVFSAIRTVRQSREQFVQDWGQIEFLYKSAKIYIEDFDNYDNFNN